MNPVTIIGGGLAGLTLGILLRRDNVPVAVIEAGKYPRHRVCGEFLSGRGREVLRELGLETNVPNAIEASTCSFNLEGKHLVQFCMEQPALCVSRFDLDHFFAEEFRRAGGILKAGERAELKSDEIGVVHATGRRRSHDARGKLFGLKAHATVSNRAREDARPPINLELHFGKREYVGICGLSANRINVCGLFYSETPIREIHREWKGIFERSVWSDTLRDVVWDEESFSSVAGITLDRHAPEDCFAIGDAAAMIPPLTGNGMSMAMESADAALPLLRRYARGEISWSDCVRDHALKWRANFSSRLRWAAFVQRLLFQPTGQRILYLGARVAPKLPNLFFSRTR